MKCKFCQAELPDNSSFCPECGKDNARTLKIITASLACLVVVVLLAGMIHYGVTGRVFPEWGKNEPSLQDQMAAMDTVVATLGEYNLTNRQLQLYYWLAAYTYTGNADLSKDLSTQVKDTATGQTYQDYFLDEAVELWKETVVMADTAKKANYQLPEQYQKELDGLREQMEYLVQMYNYYYGLQLETVDDLMQMQFGTGCNFDTYYAYSEMAYLGSTYWDSMTQDLEANSQELEDYYKKLEEDYAISVDKDFGNMVDFRNIMIPITTKEVEDGEGNKTKVEDWETCLATAQKIYDEWLAGEQTQEKFIELVAKHSKDTNTNGAGGLYSDLYASTLLEVDIRNILIPVATTGTQEDWDACLAKAQELLDEWKAGEMTANTFGALATAHSKDTGSNKAAGLYANLQKNSLKRVDVRHILVFPEGATGATVGSQTFSDEAWEAGRKEAESILNQWLAGEKTEESFGKLANEHSDDQNGQVTNGGLYSDIAVGKMVKAFENWCFDDSRQPGDYGIVKTEYGYHVMYFVHADSQMEEWVFDPARVDGETTIVKTDAGYQILYFEKADKEAENWVFDEIRKNGDVTMVKTDNGYQILYYEKAEPAWIRICTYGVKVQKAEDMLQELKDAANVTFNRDAVVITPLAQ